MAAAGVAEAAEVEVEARVVEAGQMREGALCGETAARAGHEASYDMTSIMP
jgi:hypothetical protein